MARSGVQRDAGDEDPAEDREPGVANSHIVCEPDRGR